MIYPDINATNLAIMLAMNHVKNNHNCSHHGSVIMCVTCNKIVAYGDNNINLHAEMDCLNNCRRHRLSPRINGKRKQCLL